MDPLTTAQTELASAGYDTWQYPRETGRFYFEDLSVFGMVTTYPSVQDLLEKWEDRQDQFLDTHAQVLRASKNKEKVWNAYTVHLTIGDLEGDEDEKTEQVNELFQIEENFQGTRKIARGDISSKADIRNALLPLLPIQHRPRLAAEDYRRQLKKEIKEEFRVAFLDVLNEDIPVDDIVNDLMGDQ